MGGATGNLSASKRDGGTTYRWLIRTGGPILKFTGTIKEMKAHVERHTTEQKPKGWTWEWSYVNRRYELNFYNSKSRWQPRMQVTAQRIAALKPNEVAPKGTPLIGSPLTHNPKSKGTTNTLKPPTHVEQVRAAGLAYHVDSPAQFASMIASKGDKSMVVGVMDTGATFVGYYTLTEAYELAQKLRRMRKIKFRTVTSIA